MATLSLNNIISTGVTALKNSVRRFPASIVFTVALTLYSLVRIWGEADLFTEWQDGVTVYYLLTGSLLSLSLRLWGEEVGRKRVIALVNAIAHAAMFGNAMFLYCLSGQDLAIELIIANSAVIVALCISVFTLSFFRERDDIPAWNFTLRLLGQAIASMLIGLVMWAGTAVLLYSLETLFQMEISSKCYITLPLLCCQLLPTLLFLGQIPEGEDKHNTSAESSNFINKVTRVLIIPLLGTYLLILYAYTAKILLEWQLPNGWVSMLVSTLMGGCILVEFILYPQLRKTQDSFNRFIADKLPVVILPMLLLMTIGIFRRISDYGITLNRLYLLTLNIWFYLVCIGLYLTRARRIQWIAISFGLIFLLTSAMPVNYAGMTRKYTITHIREVLDSTYHGTLPMTEEQYLDWIVTLPREEALLLNSRLKCLEYTFKDSLIKELFTTDTIAGSPHVNSPSYYTAEKTVMKAHPLKDDQKDADTVVAVEDDRPATRGCFIRFHGKQALEIPAQANANIEVYSEDSVKVVCLNSDSISILFPYGEDTDTVRIGWLDLEKWHGMRSTASPKTFRCLPSGSTFILTTIDLSIDVPTSSDKQYKAEISGIRIIDNNKKNIP